MKQTLRAAVVAGVIALASAVQAADIAIVLKSSSDPFWNAVREGIQREALKHNVTVDVLGPTSYEDFQGQQRLVEAAIEKGYKGLCVAPLSQGNLIQPVVMASKKGVFVVSIDEKFDMKQLRAAEGNIVGLVATDNVALGAKAGMFILKKLGASGGKVAIIEGKTGSLNSADRVMGATKALKSAKTIQLVASQPADWTGSYALSVVTAILMRHPDLKAIYAANDEMALGALRAIKNVGKLGQIIVVGTDGVPEALASIKRGELTATIQQNPAEIGARSLAMLLEALARKTPPTVYSQPLSVRVDSFLVTKEDLR
jgi:D-allose transport system substrate-binding protein